MIGRIVDWCIGVFDPVSALRRTAARTANERALALAAKTRSDVGYAGISRRSGDPISDQRTLSRDRARELEENNPYLGKLARAYVSQVSGNTGLVPESAATTADGKPYIEFRDAANVLWEDWSRNCDWDGPPQAGGCTFAMMCRLIAREDLVAGECFVRIIYLTAQQQADLGLPVPIQLKLYESDMLADEGLFFKGDVQTGNFIHNGIEYNASGKRVAYHFRNFHPDDERFPFATTATETVRVPVENILHIYDRRRPSRTRGITALNASANPAQKTEILNHCAIETASVAACAAMVISSARPVSSSGINAGNSERNDTEQMRQVGKMEAGAIINVGQADKVTPFTPNVQNSGVDTFGRYMLHSAAAGVPGIKATTLTGDYKGSTYSSERAGDNDCWPEIEIEQDRLIEQFVRPVWTAVIQSAILAGYFANILDNRSLRFANIKSLLGCNVTPRVPGSIDEDKEQQAIQKGIANGTDSPIAAAKRLGRNAYRSIEEAAELYKYAKEQGLPEEFCMSLLGIGKTAQAMQRPKSEGDTSPSDSPASPSRSLHVIQESA